MNNKGAWSDFQADCGGADVLRQTWQFIVCVGSCKEALDEPCARTAGKDYCRVKLENQRFLTGRFVLGHKFVRILK